MLSSGFVERHPGFWNGHSNKGLLVVWSFHIVLTTVSPALDVSQHDHPNAPHVGSRVHNTVSSHARHLQSLFFFHVSLFLCLSLLLVAFFRLPLSLFFLCASLCLAVASSCLFSFLRHSSSLAVSFYFCVSLRLCLMHFVSRI